MGRAPHRRYVTEAPEWGSHQWQRERAGKDGKEGETAAEDRRRGDGLQDSSTESQRESVAPRLHVCYVTSVTFRFDSSGITEENIGLALFLSHSLFHNRGQQR